MPDSSTLSNDEDLALAKAVDIDSLYQRYSRRSLAFLSSLGIRGADADDVLQKAWLRVLQSLRKKPFEGHFRGWLFQILRNTAIDSMRKKHPESLDDATTESAVDNIAMPDQSLIDAEYKSALHHCLGNLESVAREIVSGRLAGDSYDMVAERLNIDTARAHRVFFDAKKSLANCLRHSGFGAAS